MPKSRKYVATARRRGAAMVEFALSLGLILLITFGAIDFGRFAYFYVSLSDGVSAGARFASYHPFTPASQASWNAQTEQAVRDGLQGIVGYDASRLTVAAPVVLIDPPPLGFERVRVQANYDYRTLVNWPLVPNQLNISRFIEMRMVR